MMDVHQVTVITRNPTGPGDVGSCEVGHFTVDAGLLTMVTADGVPLRAANGERITARLAPTEEPRRVAGRFTLSRWRYERDASELVPGFDSPLRYPPDRGWK
jgi:hypothetical protein